MIDVSQWRASIGLWNYCQPASSRPANGRHSHSFKAAVDSKSRSTTSGEKTSKLPAALSHIAFLLLLFLSLSLLRHILMIPPTGKQQLQLCTCIFTGILLLGNCYQVQCTTGDIVTDTLQSVVLPGDTINHIFSLISRLLLLLSGDIELNPGPTVDEGWLSFEIIIFIFSIKACMKIKEILRSHYTTLEEASKGNLSSIMSHLYAKGIITESVRDSQSYNKMIHDFNAKLSVSKDVSELKRHCQVFLECISQGGPTDAAARTLAIEWGQVFDMDSLLLPVPASSTMISPPHTPSPSPTSNRLIAMIIFIIFVVVPVILAILFHSGNIHASNLKITVLDPINAPLKNN